MRCARSAADPPCRKPTTGIAGCWARAASGQRNEGATTAPPTAVMKSRRLIWLCSMAAGHLRVMPRRVKWRKRAAACATGGTMISQAPIFTIHADLADVRQFGTTPYGERRVVDILGGRVAGPRLNGRILPGADWQIVRPDGVTDVQARYAIETDSGARIL